MYRKIDTKMWTDPKFRNLSPHARLVFVYLITSPHGHMSGLYYLPLELCALETGLSVEQVENAIGDLFTSGLAEYDIPTCTIFVRNMMRYQGHGIKIAKAVKNHLDTIHSKELVKKFQKHNHTLLDTLSDTPCDRVSDTPSIPNPKKADKEQEKEQDQKQEKKQKQDRKNTTPPSPQGGRTKFDAASYLRLKKVPEQVITDWLEHRKAKKAKPTRTAIDIIEREAKRAGMSLAEALETSCAQGWQGFKAEWVTKDGQGKKAHQGDESWKDLPREWRFPGAEKLI